MFIRCCIAALACWLLVPPLALSAPREEPVTNRQYKRVHQDAIYWVIQNQPDRAIANMITFLKDNPDDAESHYVLAVAYAQAGRRDQALEQTRRAIDLGVPPGRFVGGTLTGLDAMRDTSLYRQLARQFAHKPVHGPMLGQSTGDGVTVWVRTAGVAKVQVVMSKSGDFGETIKSPIATTRQADDFVAKVPVKGLMPETTYHYRILIDGQHDGETTYTFRTPAKCGRSAKFRIAFGGGAGFVPPHERVWDIVRSYNPAALVMLGDNVYIDQPDSPDLQHYTYYRRQSRPEWRRLVSTTAVYAIWDDHDFALNDCADGPAIDDPPWKRPVWNVFRHNWVNPAYGGGERQPGCWFDFHIGDVHFIMLDGRFYRSTAKHNVDPPTMLGPVQKKWLLDTVARSTETFKVICSPVPWTFQAKGDSLDTWNGFKEERGEIFDFLTANRIEGIVLMSADRHRSDLWKIERPNDYALFEFNSSRFTNQHVHKTMEAAEFSYNAKQSFGLVDFDTTADDPCVTYRIISIDGEEVFAFPLRRSQLRD